LTIIAYGSIIYLVLFANARLAMSMTPSQKIEELKTKFSSLQAIEKDLRALRVDASGEKDDKLKQYVAIEQEIDRGLADL